MVNGIDPVKLLEILCCPKCKGTLAISTENAFYCRNCNNDYSFEKGIITFIKDDKRIRKTMLDWNNNAKTDHILSAAAISKENVKTPFVKLPPIPATEYLKHKVYLDLGCGYGRTLIPCSQRGARISIGIDISSIMLSKCREYCNKYKANCLLVNSDISEMPFQDNCVDVVYSAAVLLHLDKEMTTRTVNEVRRILKVGGRAFFYSSFPNKWAIWTLVQSPEYFLTEPIRHILGFRQSETRIRRYTYSEVIHLFNNFPKKEISPVNYKLFPENIGPLRVPFSNKAKQLNKKFSKIMEQVNNRLSAKLLANHFDVIVSS